MFHVFLDEGAGMDNMEGAFFIETVRCSIEYSRPKGRRGAAIRGFSGTADVAAT